jgi:hypothetical protein
MGQRRKHRHRHRDIIITEEDFNEQTLSKPAYPSEDSPGSDVTASEETLLGVSFPDVDEDLDVDTETETEEDERD